MVQRSWRRVCAALLFVALVAGVSLRAGGQQQPPAGQPATGQPPATQPPATQPPATPPPADQQQPRPTFRTGTDIVRVDVTVIDRKGMPFSALTADDFEVTEDDVTMPITSFKYVAVTGHPDDSDENSLPIRSQSHAAAEAARDDVRVFLIFWDEYHIGRMQPALTAKDYLMKFVREAFGPKDLVAFMDPLTPTSALKFTRDRLELAEQVRKLRGRLGEYMPARSVIEESHLYQMGDIEKLRSEVSISALKAAAVHLGSLRQGRKSIILFSQGMRGLRRDDETSLFQDLIRSANDSNTAFYSINPLGLQVNRSGMAFDWLETLAAETGGEYFNSNDFSRALNRVVTQSSAFYLIGYSPQQQRFDGKYHKIKVKVKKSGLEVRARNGYWAPSVADMTRAEKLAEEGKLPAPVEKALSQLPPSMSRHSIDFWVGTAVSGNGRAAVNLAWEPREQAPDQRVATIAESVSVVATGEAGQAFEGPVDVDGVSFEAVPGKLELTITAFDRAGEIIDRDKRTITVPDPDAPTLWISSPVVVSTKGAIQWRAAKDDPSPAPTAAREFNRNERLLVRFTVYGANSNAATVVGRLMTRSGSPITTLRVESYPAGGYEIDLPLTTIARGEFLLSIEAVHAEERAEALVPIRVLR